MTDHVPKESVLGVIGLGNAGHAIASAFAKLMPVHGYDLEEDKRFSASQIGIITHDQFNTFTEAIDVAILSTSVLDCGPVWTSMLLIARRGL